MAIFLWDFKKNEREEKEANRCINEYCEINENFIDDGKIYKAGLAVIVENNIPRFVRQKKLTGISLLD